jgi:hypothetical protein
MLANLGVLEQLYNLPKTMSWLAAFSQIWHVRLSSILGTFITPALLDTFLKSLTFQALQDQTGGHHIGHCH